MKSLLMRNCAIFSVWVIACIVLTRSTVLASAPCSIPTNYNVTLSAYSSMRTAGWIPSQCLLYGSGIGKLGLSIFAFRYDVGVIAWTLDLSKSGSTRVISSVVSLNESSLFLTTGDMNGNMFAHRLQFNTGAYYYGIPINGKNISSVFPLSNGLSLLVSSDNNLSYYCTVDQFGNEIAIYTLSALNPEYPPKLIQNVNDAYLLLVSLLMKLPTYIVISISEDGKKLSQAWSIVNISPTFSDILNPITATGEDSPFNWFGLDALTGSTVWNIFHTGPEFFSPYWPTGDGKVSEAIYSIYYRNDQAYSMGMSITGFSIFASLAKYNASNGRISTMSPIINASSNNPKDYLSNDLQSPFHFPSNQDIIFCSYTPILEPLDSGSGELLLWQYENTANLLNPDTLQIVRELDLPIVNSCLHRAMVGSTDGSSIILGSGANWIAGVGSPQNSSSVNTTSGWCSIGKFSFETLSNDYQYYSDGIYNYPFTMCGTADCPADQHQPVDCQMCTYSSDNDFDCTSYYDTLGGITWGFVDPNDECNGITFQTKNGDYGELVTGIITCNKDPISNYIVQTDHIRSVNISFGSKYACCNADEDKNLAIPLIA